MAIATKLARDYNMYPANLYPVPELKITTLDFVKNWTCRNARGQEVEAVGKNILFKGSCADGLETI